LPAYQKMQGKEVWLIYDILRFTLIAIDILLAILIINNKQYAIWLTGITSLGIAILAIIENTGNLVSKVFLVLLFSWDFILLLSFSTSMKSQRAN